MKRYLEEKVDSMRKQKDDELEHYKKEIERAKRFENAKMPGAIGQGGERTVAKKRIVATSKRT